MFSEMTTFARGSRRKLVARFIFFAFVPADDIVVDPITMTIDAGHAGFQVDIFVLGPLFGSIGAYVKIRVAEVTPM
jgi:hypothetical protein